MHPVISLKNSYRKYYGRAIRWLELVFRASLVLLMSLLVQFSYVYPMTKTHEDAETVTENTQEERVDSLLDTFWEYEAS